MSAARTLLALVLEYEDEGRATVRSVAARADRSIEVTHRDLTRLRSEGLVTWDDGRHGTLRPLVRRVPWGG